MDRVEHTPWQPGYLVLTLKDLRGANPYTGTGLTTEKLMGVMPHIALVANQCDINIAMVRTQSKR